MKYAIIIGLICALLAMYLGSYVSWTFYFLAFGVFIVPAAVYGFTMFMRFMEDFRKIAESREKSRNCVKCGRSIPWDANLCPYCGHDFT